MEHGLQSHIIFHHMPQQNGVLEGKIRLIIEVTRAMMNEKNYPYIFGQKHVIFQ